MWSSLKRSFAFWFGLTFVLAAFVFLPFTVSEKQTHQKLLAGGEKTEAAVVDRGQLNNDESKSHWLKMQYYDLALKEYVHQQAVPKELWDKYQIGSTIPVRYLRENPEKVSPEAMLADPEWKTLQTMGFTFGTIGVAIVGLAMGKARRTV
ncbi:DUF3592 domain-containing protein [Verrucomicrobiota bacterium sgz303538]